MGERVGAVYVHEFPLLDSVLNAPLSDNVLKNCRRIQKFRTVRRLGNCGFQHLKNCFYQQVY